MSAYCTQTNLQSRLSLSATHTWSGPYLTRYCTISHNPHCVLVCPEFDFLCFVSYQGLSWSTIFFSPSHSYFSVFSSCFLRGFPPRNLSTIPSHVNFPGWQHLLSLFYPYFHCPPAGFHHCVPPGYTFLVFMAFCFPSSILLKTISGLWELEAWFSA